jgi:hypothetical protein
MDKYYTYVGNDGFGSQYQKIIETYIYCKKHNFQFAYKPLDIVEHNYDNDIEFNNKLESLMNLKNNIINVEENMNVEVIDMSKFLTIIDDNFEKNIDNYCESEHMEFIKSCFWKNKERNHFNNNKVNVSLHIRRENSYDVVIGGAGERATTPNSYYLNIMNVIREKYKDSDKQLLFHIYSQGNIEDFNCFKKNDVTFHINDDLCDTFISLVAADILVMSPSSFSYVAGLISDGEIYYKKFWHGPRKNWIVSNL